MKDNLQKGGKGAAIGTRKTFGGKEYIRSADGWKYVGKGTGAKAKAHVDAHKASSEEGDKKTSTPAEGKGLSDHAKDTPTETLRSIAHDDSKPKEMRDAASKELKDREDGEKKVAEKHEETPKEAKPEEEKKPESKPTEEKKEEAKPTESKEAKSDTPEDKGLPNAESVSDSEVLSNKGGAAKLSEAKEGFSVDKPAVLTSESDEDAGEDDINHKFEAFGRFAAGVIKGRMKSLVAYGSGGVGKTYTVTQELEKAGKKIFNPELHDAGDSSYDYVKMTGKMTAAAVYQAMYEHNGKLLLFDDCDSVLQDDNAINLFKGALDTSGDGMIDWGSAKKLKDSTGTEIPGKFPFNGRAIFISNLNVGKDEKGKQQNEQLQPIVSRGYSVNLSMDKKKTMERIKHIATSKDGKLTNLKFPGVPDYDHEDMEAVFAYMDKHKDKASDLNVRTVGTLLAIKKDADEAGVNWQDDAKYVYLRKAVQTDIYGGAIFDKRKDAIEKAVGIDNRTIEDKKIDWCEMKKASLHNRITSNQPV